MAPASGTCAFTICVTRRQRSLSTGTHPKVVSERLGQAIINITLDTYSHVLPGLHEAAIMIDTLLTQAT